MTAPSTKALDNLRTLVEDGLRYTIDTERFKAIVNAAFEVLQIRECDLSHACGVSVTTVKRWRNGNACPYHLMRHVPYRWLLTKIDEAQGKLP